MDTRRPGAGGEDAARGREHGAGPVPGVGHDRAEGGAVAVTDGSRRRRGDRRGGHGGAAVGLVRGWTGRQAGGRGGRLSAAARRDLGSGNQSAAAADRQHSLLWMDRDAFTAAGLVDAGGTARPHGVPRYAVPDAPRDLRGGQRSRIPGRASAHGSWRLRGAAGLSAAARSPRPGGHQLAANAGGRECCAQVERGARGGGPRADPGSPARPGAPTRKATEPSATDRMAVITPYRDQATALQKSVRYRFGADFDGFADTVHRFQGSQRPILVVDTVAGAGDKPGCFHEGTGLSSQTCRLLNVTLSRAQDHLVVVADVDFLSAHVDPGSEVAPMLAYLRRHADRLSVDDLIPVRSAAELAGLPEDDLVRSAFFPADEVPRAVSWDIARARESIDVCRVEPRERMHEKAR